ncbi:hypothetical protein DM02DRAFT_660195 [Periconia macrospinosa]|uniref:Uncharacterized protein n=1 Tax=Periconia macrospinosa TaxID=97972 RepID=A0A2V1DCT4_9PLEO|nr:hypothetical protein DM02DRAFT_660195 [Periconia macrospinosa]
MPNANQTMPWSKPQPQANQNPNSYSGQKRKANAAPTTGPMLPPTTHKGKSSLHPPQRQTESIMTDGSMDNLSQDSESDEESVKGRTVVENEIENPNASGETPKPSVQLPISDTDIQRAKLLAYPPVPPNPVHLYKERFLEFGYTALVDLVRAKSDEMGHPFFSGENQFDENLSHAHAWRFHGAELLESIPRCLLVALLDDTLSNSERADDVHRYFESSHPWYKRQSEEFAPLIYCRMFVDASGNSPSAGQLRDIILCMRQYVSGDPSFDEQNAEIDNLSRSNTSQEEIRRGLHHHLNEKKQRVLEVHTFCHALETYLDEKYPTSQNQDSPIAAKLKYIGFSAGPPEGQRAHDRGDTNFLAALFNDIGRYLFQEPSKEGHSSIKVPTFSFSQYIVAYLVDEVECHLGEEIFARACNAYYTSGLGFNIAPAGLNVAGADLGDSKHSKALELWNQCQEFRDRQTFYGEQMCQENFKNFPVYLRWMKTDGRVDGKPRNNFNNCIDKIIKEKVNDYHDEIEDMERRMKEYKELHEREVEELIAAKRG